MTWGCRESERLLRRWIALEVMLVGGALLLWADILWGPLSRDKETADAVGEYLRSKRVAHGAD